MPFDDEDQRRAYWETVEEDRPEVLDEDLDKPMSDDLFQWCMEVNRISLNAAILGRDCRRQINNCKLVMEEF